MVRSWARAIALCGAMLAADMAWADAPGVASPAFEVDARGAVQVPFGDRAGVPLSDDFDLRPGFQLDAGVRLLHGHLSLLGLFAFGPGTARPSSSGAVSSALRDQLHVWRFGGQLIVRPLMWDYVEPWGGLALGAEVFMGDVGFFFTPQVGFDFRIYRFRFGPYFEAPMGWFLRSTYAGNDFHGWFNVGLKLAFVLG